MAAAYVVLSDDLLKLYLGFTEGDVSGYSKKEIRQFFSFYKPHLTNKAQYDRIGAKMETALETQLEASGLNGLSLNQLKNHTQYKLILTSDKNSYAYPYLNIDGNDKIQLNYTGSFGFNNRSKCKDHIKALCLNASKITIYDKYLCTHDNIESGLLDSLFGLFNSTLKTKVFVMLPLDPALYSSQKAAYDSWHSAKASSYKNLDISSTQVDASEDYHDRYLFIEGPTGKIEVLLSSGFYYLFNNAKDFTYIVKSK